LLEILDPTLNGEFREALLYAARLLDIGRSVDFYNRHEHTTDIVLDSDLSGFTHRATALLAAMVRLAGKDGVNLKPFAPLVATADQPTLARAAAILDLGDSIVRQWPPESEPPPSCTRDAARLMLAAPWLHAWPLQPAARRVEQVFAVQVRVDGS
jgi:exopolyphosphatase/pppGpp-phosphohydrolase